MDVEFLNNCIACDFYCGVPDSQLKALCNFLMGKYGIDKNHHLVAANEGNCVAIATGYHLATGRIPAVYMQNSGLGNIVNPVTSLISEKVYSIPMIFLVGWRGEPNVHDEPQHVFQGKITLDLLTLLNIRYIIVTDNMSNEQFRELYETVKPDLDNGKSIAIVFRKNSLKFNGNIKYENNNFLTREEVLDLIVEFTRKDPIVTTTGKTSRELFEIRERRHESHEYDFLTVGSMGHCSSIALGISMAKPDTRVWCIDGDGALLMHMGALAVIGSSGIHNLFHVVINNEAHESVGGMPTVSKNIDLCRLAASVGYEKVYSVSKLSDLKSVLFDVSAYKKLTFIEIKCALGSRADLGRPTTTTYENKAQFQQFLKSI